MLIVNIDWKPKESDRKLMPSTAFLLPRERKFPYKVYANPNTKRRMSLQRKGGKWAISCKMLRDALTLANMHGYKKVAQKAKTLLNKYCK